MLLDRSNTMMAPQQGPKCRSNDYRPVVTYRRFHPLSSLSAWTIFVVVALSVVVISHNVEAANAVTDKTISSPWISSLNNPSRPGFESHSHSNVLAADAKRIAKSTRNPAEKRSATTAVTGRLFFFKGLKKFMWPAFVVFNLIKTTLLALFLPSILGSLGKIVGKGLSSVSSFAHPHMETPEDLDFKDNHFNSDMMDSLDAAPQTSYEQYSLPNDHRDMMMTGHPMFDALQRQQQNAKDTISRYGPGGQKVTFLKQDDSATAASQHDFKQFHEMPASSTLLSNYDPFYSPLLSRLDSVFQQMGLGDGDENCREKLVCLMYANPAKYAPYSNLVSAQLSRELNQLRKPSSDNPEIMRFFRYMRAARGGQEETNCDHYRMCPNLTENTNPAMIKTFNDINKLVQARKLH